MLFLKRGAVRQRIIGGNQRISSFIFMSCLFVRGVYVTFGPAWVPAPKGLSCYCNLNITSRRDCAPSSLFI